MLEITGITFSPLRLIHKDGSVFSDTEELAYLKTLVCKELHIRDEKISSCTIRKRSIDARKKQAIKLVYTLWCTLVGADTAESHVLESFNAHKTKRGATKHQLQLKFIDESAPTNGRRDKLRSEQQSTSVATRSLLSERPIVVVGAGCAGLFCALTLARAGLRPLLIERGDNAERRTRVIERFTQQRQLDPESNIQFGLGGAGTFSDGKLYTGTRSAHHHFILQTMVDAGADPHILFDAHPHVGSDVLPRVVTSIAREIEELGGEILFRTKMVGLELEGETAGKHVNALTLEHSDKSGITHTERLLVSDVVLACGHSARDVYELLVRCGVVLEAKPFAMGVRIEHLQTDVDKTQYGDLAGNPVLGAAPYKLAIHLDKSPHGKRSVFSFCMCPGGEVVAATSEEGAVVTNGMSKHARSTSNANAGLLVNVTPDDVMSFVQDTPNNSSFAPQLAGIAFQRHWEQSAYALAGANYVAPAQLVGDFLAKRSSTGGARIQASYPLGVCWTSLDDCLPTFVTESIRAALPLMTRKLSFFADEEAVLTGVESRSSAPVRIVRQDGCALGIQGLWPAGEGAGYAGGIMSAAADGISIAKALIERWTHSTHSLC